MRISRVLWCGLVAMVAVAMVTGLTGCQWLEGAPLQEIEHRADALESHGDPRPTVRVPTRDGESMSAKSTAGFDGYVVDDGGVDGLSSQPKTITSAPLGSVGRLVSASPGDTSIDEVAADFNDDGSLKMFRIKGYKTTISTAIAALDSQAEGLVRSMAHLNTEDKLRRIEELRAAEAISSELAQAAVKVILQAATGVPVP